MQWPHCVINVLNNGIDHNKKWCGCLPLHLNLKYVYMWCLQELVLAGGASFGDDL